MTTLPPRSAPLFVVALSALLPLAASGQLTGPDYPPPGGVTWTPSGTDPIYAPGATWSYSGLDHSAFDELYWRFVSIDNPWTTLQGKHGFMTFSSYTETSATTSFIDYVSSSHLAIDLADDPGQKHLAPVTLRVSVTGAPLNTTLFGSPAVNLSDPGITSFSVSFRYFTTGGEPIGDLFNRLATEDGDALHTSASAGFYSTPPVSTVPEPSTVFLLAFGLLGVAYVAWRRREGGLDPLEG